MGAALRLAATLMLLGFLAQAALAQASEEILALVVNGEAVEQPMLVRRAGGDALLLRAADLETLRLRARDADGIQVDGETYYPIGNRSGERVVVDPVTQTAEITVPADAFDMTRVIAGNPAGAGGVSTSTGGFVNYDLYLQSTHETAGGAVLDGGLFGRLGVATFSALAREEAGDREALRLDTTWTRDFPDRLATLRVGDSISAAGAWGQAVRFGGIQFGTNFSTQPTLITTPLLSASGEAVVPSTIDVFINGQQRASEAVPPGPFTIDNLAAVNGSGQLQVVITDALGRQQVVVQPYYSGTSLLRSGLSEYSVELGAIREDYGIRSNAYGDMVAAGTWRQGVNDRFTAEFHGEAQADGVVALGSDGAFQLGALGVLSSTLAVGGDSDGTGWLWGLGFEHAGERFSLFGRGRFASESFAQLSTASLRWRPKMQFFGGAGFDLEQFGSLQLAYGRQTQWSGPELSTISLSHSISLGAAGFVNLSATRVMGEDSQTDLLLSWTMPLGERRTAGAGLEYAPDRDDRDTMVAGASLQQSLPRGSGTGYLVSVASNDEGYINGSYQGRAGRASLGYARRDGEAGVQAEVTGGIAITGEGLMASRRLDQSFAVVKVADYADLTVYVDNQPVARTDQAGRVLLDSLRPYDTNLVSLDPTELPMDAALKKASMSVVPASRSGAVLRFPVRRVRAATMRLALPGGAAVPAGAQVALGPGRHPVALDGLVYIEDLPDAVEGTARWADRSCSFVMPSAETADAVADLGVVPCKFAAD